MKKFAYILILFITLVLTSCGVSGGHFKFEGKFLNMNQGEFYVYSPDGGFEGVDTIKVEGGRFTFETECKEDFTIMLVFPNAASGTRTRTAITGQGILSPSCLPIPPLRHGKR